MFITQDLVWLPKEVGHNMTILFIYLFIWLKKIPEYTDYVIYLL